MGVRVQYSGLLFSDKVYIAEKCRIRDTMREMEIRTQSVASENAVGLFVTIVCHFSLLLFFIRFSVLHFYMECI